MFCSETRSWPGFSLSTHKLDQTLPVLAKDQLNQLYPEKDRDIPPFVSPYSSKNPSNKYFIYVNLDSFLHSSFKDFPESDGSAPPVDVTLVAC